MKHFRSVIIKQIGKTVPVFLQGEAGTVFRLWKRDISLWYRGIIETGTV